MCVGFSTIIPSKESGRCFVRGYLDRGPAGATMISLGSGCAGWLGFEFFDDAWRCGGRRNEYQSRRPRCSNTCPLFSIIRGRMRLVTMRAPVHWSWSGISFDRTVAAECLAETNHSGRDDDIISLHWGAVFTPRFPRNLGMLY